MKVDVVVYYAGSGGVLHEQERFVCKSLKEARTCLLDWYWTELDLVEWNIRANSYSISAYEAHIYGYARDEHIMLTLEDHGKSELMEVYNELHVKNPLG